MCNVCARQKRKVNERTQKKWQKAQNQFTKPNKFSIHMKIEKPMIKCVCTRARLCVRSAQHYGPATMRETQNIYIDYTVPFHSIADVVHVLSTFRPSSSSPTNPYMLLPFSARRFCTLLSVHTEFGTTFYIYSSRNIISSCVVYAVTVLSLTWPKSSFNKNDNISRSRTNNVPTMKK